MIYDQWKFENMKKKNLRNKIKIINEMLLYFISKTIFQIKDFTSKSDLIFIQNIVSKIIFFDMIFDSYGYFSKNYHNQDSININSNIEIIEVFNIVSWS